MSRSRRIFVCAGAAAVVLSGLAGTVRAQGAVWEGHASVFEAAPVPGSRYFPGTRGKSLTAPRTLIRREAGDGSTAAPGEREEVWIEELSAFFRIPDGLSVTEGEDGFYYIYVNQEDSIPYVIFGRYHQEAASFLDSFTRMMKRKYADLKIVQEAADTTAGGRPAQKIIYQYSVGGYTVTDTRLAIPAGEDVYMFGSKEVASLGYTVGNLLETVAGSLRLAEEDAGKSGSDLILLPGEEDTLPSGTMYSLQTVYDTDNGIPVGRCFLPAGCSLTCSLDWLSGKDRPLSFALAAENEDKSVVFGWHSPHGYHDAVSFIALGEEQVEGPDDGSVWDISTRSWLLDFMSAEEYSDEMADRIAGEGREAVLVHRQAMPAAAQKKMDLRETNRFREENSRLEKTDGYTTSVDGTYSGWCEQTYEVTEKGGDAVQYLTIYTRVEGIQETKVLPGASAGTSTATEIDWDAEVFFMITDEEHYLGAMAAFEDFRLNSTPSDQFLGVQELLASEIGSAVDTAQKQGTAISIDEDKLKEILLEQLQGTTSYGQQAEDDGLYNYQVYRLSDGTALRLLTVYPYVAEDAEGMVCLAEDMADIPEGAALLEAGQ